MSDASAPADIMLNDKFSDAQRVVLKAMQDVGFVDVNFEEWSCNFHVLIKVRAPIASLKRDELVKSLACVLYELGLSDWGCVVDE